MALSNIITLPLLRGTVSRVGAWNSLVGLSDRRVYPFALGCLVRTSATVAAGGTINTHGKGEFATNGYAMVCAATSYGEGTLFQPDRNRMIQITSVSTTDDVLTSGDAVSVSEGDLLLNLGTDSATGGLPQFDGSSITLYDDNVGNNTNSNAYLTTSRGGWYRAWVQSGVEMVDLLITDESNVPVVAIPFVPTTGEIQP